MVGTSKSSRNRKQQLPARLLVLAPLLGGIGMIAGFAMISSLPVSKDQLMAEMANSRPVAAGPVWSTRRGRAPAVLASRDSFRLGVWSLELSLAAERKDEKSFQENARNIRQLLAATRAPELRQFMKEMSSVEAAQEQCRLLDDLLAESSWLLDTSQYAFGKWTMSAWQILEQQKYEMSSGLMREWNYPGIAGEALSAKNQVAEMMRRKEYERALTSLRELLEDSGQSAEDFPD